MARDHVSMAIGIPSDGVIAGMKNHCQAVIDINMVRAMNSSPAVPFWIDKSKVVLSEGLQDGSIPAAYFRWVLDYKKQIYLH